MVGDCLVEIGFLCLEVGVLFFVCFDLGLCFVQVVEEVGDLCVFGFDGSSVGGDVGQFWYQVVGGENWLCVGNYDLL